MKKQKRKTIYTYVDMWGYTCLTTDPEKEDPHDTGSIQAFFYRDYGQKKVRHQRWEILPAIDEETAIRFIESYEGDYL